MSFASWTVVPKNGCAVLTSILQELLRAQCRSGYRYQHTLYRASNRPSEVIMTNYNMNSSYYRYYYCLFDLTHAHSFVKLLRFLIFSWKLKQLFTTHSLSSLFQIFSSYRLLLRSGTEKSESLQLMPNLQANTGLKLEPQWKPALGRSGLTG